MITVKNLYAKYDTTNVLNGVSLKISPGDFWGIIGPNGAGKSTLIKCMSGFLSPMKGEIMLHEIPLRGFTCRERAQHISVVTQHAHVEFDFSVREIVLMGRYPHLGFWQQFSEKDYSDTERILEIVGIPHLANRSLSQLSGGEFQLAMIARALNQNSELILCDEPGNHLDIHHQLKIFQLLHTLNQKGKTIITVSHNINLAAEFCNSLVLIDNGKIIKQGKTEEIIQEKLLSKIYGTAIKVITNPFSGKPNILLSVRKHEQ